MNEARRFLRYIFPGMIFFILLFLYLFISATDKLLDDVSRFALEPKGGSGFLQVGVLLLFVAGAGYFFATIYHTFSKIFRCRLPDSRGLLSDSQLKRWVEVINRRTQKHNPVPIDTIYTPSQAWSILGAYYHARIHEDKFIKAHVRIESLNDTLHGLGASVVASGFSWGAWKPLHGILTCGQDFNRCYNLIPLVVTVLMIVNYILTGKETERFIDGITSQFMADESRDGEWPISLYFPG